MMLRSMRKYSWTTMLRRPAMAGQGVFGDHASQRYGIAVRTRGYRLPKQLVSDHIDPHIQKFAKLFGQAGHPQQRVAGVGVQVD